MAIEDDVREMLARTAGGPEVEDQVRAMLVDPAVQADIDKQRAEVAWLEERQRRARESLDRLSHPSFLGTDPVGALRSSVLPPNEMSAQHLSALQAQGVMGEDIDGSFQVDPGKNEPGGAEKMAMRLLPAATSLVPAAGGAGGGALAGAGIGAAVGGPVSPLTAILGGLIGGAAGARGAGALQDVALGATGLRGDVGQALAEERQAEPGISMLSELAPQLAFMQPSRAANVAGRALGGGIGGGMEASQQALSGAPLDPYRIGLQTVAGALLDKPTRAGGALGLNHVPDTPAAIPIDVSVPPVVRQARSKVVDLISAGKITEAAQAKLYRGERGQRAARLEKLMGGEESAPATLPETKVVDEAGAPRDVFHGTTAEFETHDPSRFAQFENRTIPGIYYSEGRDAAALYARGPRGRVKTAKLNIKNPLDMDAVKLAKNVPPDMLAAATDELNSKLETARAHDIDQVERGLSAGLSPFAYLDGPTVRNLAEQFGYDGATTGRIHGAREWIAFSPDQVIGPAAPISGEALLKPVMGALKGELPREVFEPVRPAFDQVEIDALYDTIWNYTGRTATKTSRGKPVKVGTPMGPHEKAKAAMALKQILDPDVRVAPQRAELAALANIFPDIAQAHQANRSWKAKAGDLAVRGLNLPREIATSFDMSNPLRQSLLLTVGRPRQSIPAAGKMIHTFFSEKAYRALEADLASRPNRKLYDEAGLYLAPEMGERGKLKDVFRQTTDLTAQEEAFSSGLGEMLPGIGRVVRASNRAYNAYANKLRADVFDTMANDWMRGGVTPETHPLKYQQLGEYINDQTGRGSYGKGKMGEYLERGAPLLNMTFYSPRFLASRFRTLANVITLGQYSNMPKELRLDLARNVGATVAAGLTMIALAKKFGPRDTKVESDPRSVDYGKIRYGNRRVDVWGGFSQWIRFASQMALGSTVTADGDIRVLNRNPKDPMSQTYADVAGRFTRSKLSPVPGAIVDLLTGSTFQGDPLDRGAIAEKIAPMVGSDFYDAYKDGLQKPDILALPAAFFGAGLQTYDRPLHDVEDGLRNRDPSVGEKIELGIAEGRFSPEQAHAALRRSKMDALMARYRQLPLEDLEATLQTQEPSVQRRFAPLVEIKRLRLKEREANGRMGLPGINERATKDRLNSIRSQIKALTNVLIDENEGYAGED